MCKTFVKERRGVGMVRNETDRRVRRTRAQLQKALLELLEE